MRPTVNVPLDIRNRFGTVAVTMSNADDDIPTMVRMSPDLRDRIRELARAQDRSMAGEIREAIRAHLERHEQEVA